jgi:hypothetical protein
MRSTYGKFIKKGVNVLNNVEEYEHLVEIVARARVLAAHSDDKFIVQNASKIKDDVLQMIKELGLSVQNFNSKTVDRYKELNKYQVNI